MSSQSIWQNTPAQTRGKHNGSATLSLPLSLFLSVIYYETHVAVIKKKKKRKEALVRDRYRENFGICSRRINSGQSTRLDSAKKTGARIQNKFRAREISRRAPRGAWPERARTPSKTHAPQMHPYTTDVARSRWKLVPSTQYFTCVLCYTAQ